MVTESGKFCWDVLVLYKLVVAKKNLFVKWTSECQLMFPSSQCYSEIRTYLETSGKISTREEGEGKWKV